MNPTGPLGRPKAARFVVRMMTALLCGVAFTTAAAGGAGAAAGVVEQPTTEAPASQLLAQPGQSFGASVALIKDLALIGVPGSQSGAGSVGVYALSQLSYKEITVLSASDAEAGDGFGSSLALQKHGSNIVALVGAPGHAASAGAAYVFTDVGGAWSQSAELVASDGTGGDDFGSAVAFEIKGASMTAVVGAPGHNGSAGSAYVFREHKGIWSQSAELQGSGTGGGSEFGSSVAVAGSNAVVGAPGQDASAGAAFVFAGRRWKQKAALTDPGGLAGDGFGHSVTEGASTIAVGAPGANDTSGVAFIYGLSEGTWKLSTAIGSPDGAPGDAFGDSISLSPSLDYFGAHYPKPSPDTAILVGAPGQDASSGAAYLLFEDKGSTDWQKHELSSPSDSGFGSSVSLSGTNAFVGSPLLASSSGAANWFTESFGGADGLWLDQQRLLSDSDFGQVIASSGTVTAISSSDGVEVFTGSGSSWTETAQLEPAGGVLAVSDSTIVVGSGDRTYVFTQSDAVWSQTAVLTPSPPLNGQFGGLAISGNTVFMGSDAGTGSVYVFTESGGTWTQTAQLTASDAVTGGDFGFTISAEGSSVMIGAPRDAGTGAVYLFTETDGTWTQSAELTPSDGTSGEGFGITVDLNGSEAAIGSNESPNGAVYVFSNSDGTWLQEAEVSQTDGVTGDDFAWGVISGTTLLVAAPGANSDTGAAFVYTSSGGVWSQTAELLPPSGHGGDCGAGAIVGSNLLLGCPYDYYYPVNGFSPVGSVFVY